MEWAFSVYLDAMKTIKTQSKMEWAFSLFGRHENH